MSTRTIEKDEKSKYKKSIEKWKKLKVDIERNKLILLIKKLKDEKITTLEYEQQKERELKIKKISLEIFDMQKKLTNDKTRKEMNQITKKILEKRIGKKLEKLISLIFKKGIMITNFIEFEFYKTELIQYTKGANLYSSNFDQKKMILMEFKYIKRKEKYMMNIVAKLYMEINFVFFNLLDDKIFLVFVFKEDVQLVKKNLMTFFN